MLDPHISTRGEMGHIVLTVLGMVVQMERRFIKERQRDGIERAKASAVTGAGFGRWTMSVSWHCYGPARLRQPSLAQWGVPGCRSIEFKKSQRIDRFEQQAPRWGLPPLEKVIWIHLDICPSSVCRA